MTTFGFYKLWSAFKNSKLYVQHCSSCFTTEYSSNNTQSIWYSRNLLQTQLLIPLCNLELESKLIAALTITSDLVFHSTSPHWEAIVVAGWSDQVQRGAGVVTPPQAPRHWPARGRRGSKSRWYSTLAIAAAGRDSLHWWSLYGRKPDEDQMVLTLVGCLITEVTTG